MIYLFMAEKDDLEKFELYNRDSISETILINIIRVFDRPKYFMCEMIEMISQHCLNANYLIITDNESAYQEIGNYFKSNNIAIVSSKYDSHCSTIINYLSLNRSKFRDIINCITINYDNDISKIQKETKNRSNIFLYLAENKDYSNFKNKCGAKKVNLNYNIIYLFDIIDDFNDSVSNVLINFVYHDMIYDKLIPYDNVVLITNDLYTFNVINSFLSLNKSLKYYTSYEYRDIQSFLSTISGYSSNNINDCLDTDSAKNTDTKSEFTIKHISTDEDGNTIKILYDNKYDKEYIIYNDNVIVQRDTNGD